MRFVLIWRGVLQSLVEKHFPAPDRQKLFSLLGIDLSAKKTPSPAETKEEQKGKKRKGTDLKFPINLNHNKLDISLPHYSHQVMI